MWTAGVKPHPLVAELGLPLDERSRIRVDSSLRVEGRSNVWALGDCACVPNEATPEQADPPTCQHALRHARRLAKNLKGKEKAYGYRMTGQGATLGRDKGIANLFGHFNFRGSVGATVTRMYHLHQLPLRSRKLRVMADGVLVAGLRQRHGRAGPPRAVARRARSGEREARHVTPVAVQPPGAPE